MNLFKSIGNHKRSVIGYATVVLLIGLGILTYFILQNRGQRVSPYQRGIEDKKLQEGVNHYKLGEYERSRLLLLNLIDTSDDKRVASTAALYLGNIAFKNGDYGEALVFYRASADLDGNNFFAFYNAALVFLQLGDLEGALKNARKAVDLSVDFSRAELLLANIYYSMGRFRRAYQLYGNIHDELGLSTYNLALALVNEGRMTEALEQLEMITSDSESDELVSALSSIGVAMVGVGLPDDRNTFPIEKSSDHLGRALEVFDGSPSLKYNRALLFILEGRYAEAIDLLGSTSGTSDREQLFLLGYALYRNGYYRKALVLWERLREEFGEDDQGQIARVLGDIHYNLGNWGEAERYYRVAIEDRTAIDAYANLVLVYVQMGEYESAFEVCIEYAEKTGYNDRALLSLAELSFQTGRIQSAKHALKRAVKLIGDDDEGLEMVGALYTRNGMYNSALRLYLKILSEHPERVDIHGRIAEIYLQTGHPTRARSELEALMNSSVDGNLHYSASILLAGVEGGTGAEERLRELIVSFPDRYEAYYSTGLLLFEQGNYPGVLEIVEQCLQNVPSIDAESISRLYTLSGVASTRTGGYDEAARFFSKALEYDRGNEIAAINQKLVQEYPF